MDLSQVKPAEAGDIVLYTVKDGQRAGETRGAVITRTFTQKGEDGSEVKLWNVNLTLFPDQSNPALHEEQHASSVLYDETGKPGTWRYKTPAPAALDEVTFDRAFQDWIERKETEERYRIELRDREREEADKKALKDAQASFAAPLPPATTPAAPPIQPAAETAPAVPATEPAKKTGKGKA